MLEGNWMPFSPFPYILQRNSFKLYGLTSIATYLGAINEELLETSYNEFEIYQD